jgi:hypothetical protein
VIGLPVRRGLRFLPDNQATVRAALPLLDLAALGRAPSAFRARWEAAAAVLRAVPATAEFRQVERAATYAPYFPRCVVQEIMVGG